MPATAASFDAGIDKLDKLKNLTPLTDEEMKKLLPEQVEGLKRSAVELSNVVGKIASAKYEKQPDAAFVVNITDCAGEMGAGKYMMAYMAPVATEDSPPATAETANLTTQKKVDFAGQQAISRHDPVNNVYSLVFMHKDRLFVDVSGPAGTSLADVLAFATKLDSSL
ncbi:hypothetical protein [Hymenobacter elongatus]|uniref:Uncharacterized protein n=1 Tax=Hymenobacter elongatus TaxID=877208 RepID=A0A4Z0PPV6_9BACT|nr:hypothetical protein [Hymenobacter elongatus]TGE18895.1 hypothetical protein E5J99_03900 [Hymenobacter elongatus]